MQTSTMQEAPCPQNVRIEQPPVTTKYVFYGQPQILSVK